MYDIINYFLLLPIGVRAAIILGILLLLLLIILNPIFKIFSILVWILQKIIIGIYLLLEIPISALHSKFGSIFGIADQGITSGTEKIYIVFEKIYKKAKYSKSMFRKPILACFLVLLIYLLIPVVSGFTNLQFTFWQEYYIEVESNIINWINNNGVLN